MAFVWRDGIMRKGILGAEGEEKHFVFLWIKKGGTSGHGSSTSKDLLKEILIYYFLFAVLEIKP